MAHTPSRPLRLQACRPSSAPFNHGGPLSARPLPATGSPAAGPQLADHSRCEVAPLPHLLSPSLHRFQPSSLVSDEALPPPPPAPSSPLRITSTPPFLFVLSLFLPSWCVPASSPSLLVIILWLDNQNFPIIAAFTRPTAQIAIQKKRLKKEASGKAHHKIILILVFYLRTYHPFRCHCHELWADRFSSLFDTRQRLIFRRRTSQTTRTHFVIRPRKNQYTLLRSSHKQTTNSRHLCLSRSRGDCPVHPSCFFDGSIRHLQHKAPHSAPLPV